MQLESLPQKFNPEVCEVIDFINKKGFKVGLIGGVTRDYLLRGVLSHDIDCELRHVSESVEDKYWQDLFDGLKHNHHVQMLAYEVIQVQCGNFHLDLSRPRRENFNNKIHHKNFEAEFIPDPEYTESFKRRDLTINAIMLEIHDGNVVIIDPLDGQKHIEDKVLEICSEDFSRDPVRFLRAMRFKHLLGFKFSKTLKSLFKGLSRIECSNHYYKLEFTKSQNILDMFMELGQIDNAIKMTKINQEQIAALYNSFKGHSTQDLCQAIGLSQLSSELKEYCISLFGYSKTIIVPKKKFKSDVLALSYEDKKFQIFIDWLILFIEKVPVMTSKLVLSFSGIDMDDESILSIDKTKPEIDLSSITPKLRKYYLWKHKIMGVCESEI